MLKKKTLLAEAEEIREKILASRGSVTLDLGADRDDIRHMLRANVERIEVDCDDKYFFVLLKNGIHYNVEAEGDIVMWYTEDPEASLGEGVTTEKVKEPRLIFRNGKLDIHRWEVRSVKRFRKSKVDILTGAESS